MKYLMIESGQFKYCPDIYEKLHKFLFAPKKEALVQAIAGYQTTIAAWFAHRKIQTMWQIQLPLCRRKWARTKLLPFCQFTGQKTCFNLRIHGKQTDHRRGVEKLSRNTENHGKYQRYQSRIIFTKSKFLKRKLWYLKWIQPP